MSDEPDTDDELEAGAEGQDGDQPPANDDAASPKQLRNKERRLAREARETQEFWSSVFATPVGRREMWKLLTSAHTFDERFACGPNGFPQPEATWFQAGEQSFGQRVYRTWARDHRVEVLLMHDENDPAFVKAKK